MENYQLLERNEIIENNTKLCYRLLLVDAAYCLSVSINDVSYYVDNFTVNLNFALYVYNKLVDGRVHPCHLRDVIADFLAEYDPNMSYPVTNDKIIQFQ